MDDSQSSEFSDFLYNSVEYSSNSPGNMDTMDTIPYDSLVSRTKASITENLNCGASKFSLSQFTSILADCSSCISQSLDLIIGLIVDTDVHYRSLTQYMDNAIYLLQKLSIYINTVLQSVAMSCCTMKTFPVTTGNIVIAVFTHCRDSEILYGKHLRHVEKEIKELFKTCHELQLTYLMVLEKHFVFDLTEKMEQDILIKALDINLVIGDIVQTLDVKTMAEQWKAYTMICEKHSSFLNDKMVFNDCTKIVCNMATKNITTAIEADQEDKVVLRSLKVASFAIKILLKLYGIFKHASEKKIINIIEFMVFINKHNQSYLEMDLKKQTLFIHQITSTVFAAIDLLLVELVSDEAFIQGCLQYTAETTRVNEDLSGFLVLMTSVTEKMLHKTDHSPFTMKHIIIKCIFNILPKCHVCFNSGLKFLLPKSNQQSCGLYEHVLIHSIALAFTLNAEDYLILEQVMYEALLGTDAWTALFASDLWVALSRGNRQLLIEQFVFLCKTYQKLENNRLFAESPQREHLSYTIGKLFDTMKTEDKVRLYSRYNLPLWTPVQIKNIPSEIQEKANDDTMNDLSARLENFLSFGIEKEDKIREMAKLMKAAATCRLEDCNESLEDYVTKIWVKSCPKHRVVLNLGEFDKSSRWYLEYVEALVALTKAMLPILTDNTALAKILHVISNIAQLGNTELNLLILDLLCQISLYILNDTMNKLESLVTETYTNILQKNDNIANNSLFIILTNYTSHKNFDNIISVIFSLDSSLEESYGSLLQGSVDIKRWKDHLQSDHLYIHKCLPSAQVVELSSSGASRELRDSKNFEFADIDSLFGGESDPDQPVSKKAKLANVSRNEEIISRLENDSLSLSSEKENVFSNDEITRIKAVYYRLKNIVD